MALACADGLTPPLRSAWPNSRPKGRPMLRTFPRKRQPRQKPGPLARGCSPEGRTNDT